MTEEQSKQNFPEDSKIPTGMSPDLEDVPTLGQGETGAAPSPPVPEPKPVHDIELQKLRVKYDKQSARSIELQKIIEEGQAELKILTHEMATISHLFQKPEDPKQNQKNIMDYIATQNRLRIEKAEARKKVLGNLKLEEVLPTASKLDMAMARKKGLGNQRPAPRPIMTG
jgi:hypothetical protein